MTEENKFFFEYTENSTELYREAQLPEEFNLKSFFEEPSSNDLFIEVEASSFEEENIFRIQENFEFPTHLKEKFVRLFSESIASWFWKIGIFFQSCQCCFCRDFVNVVFE